MRWTVLLGLVIVSATSAQAPKEDTTAKVVGLLKTLNAAFLNRDADTMKKLMTDDHVAILSSGQRQTRDEHLKSLADLKLSGYTMENVQVITPGKDVLIVTYRAALKGTFQGKELPALVYASSVWVNRDGTWLEALYHETPLPKK
jgi:uncharacterized protein (TIGR02246 family)